MNKKENIIDYPGLGKVRYVSNKRSKSMSVRINASGDVRVSVPRFVGFGQAERFVLSKSSWIRMKLLQMESLRSQEPVLREGDSLSIKGEEYILKITGRDRNLEDAAWRIIGDCARRDLPVRLESLAGTYGFTYAGLKIRRMKSRWGSCTAKNSINLNSWLVMLPEHLCDYVILHELAHTKVKDHSPRFWKVLNNITYGRAIALRNELRKYPIMAFRFEEEG